MIYISFIATKQKTKETKYNRYQSLLIICVITHTMKPKNLKIYNSTDKFCLKLGRNSIPHSQDRP